MEPPVKPTESDCCNSGCNPCILDVYEEQLRKFNNSTKLQQAPKANCLSPTSFNVFKLINIKSHTKNCNFYTFEYTKSCDKSVLFEPGQYLMLKAQWQEKTFQRAYTPLYVENLPDNQFMVLVKLYDDGLMSKYFQTMSVGAKTLWRGPYGNFKVDYSFKKLFFIAQGTGVAPFYTIICDMLKNDECFTFLKLFYCCSADNVLLREKLYKLREHWNFQYELFIPNTCKEDFLTKYEETVHYRRLDCKDFESIAKEYEKQGSKILICGSDSFSKNLKLLFSECKMPEREIVVF